MSSAMPSKRGEPGAPHPPIFGRCTETHVTEDEKRLQDEAIAYAKAHRTAIARRITDPEIHPPEAAPVTVFMAGSPGAGKTEASIELLEMFGSNGGQVLRIDPDELRAEFPGYTGGNAWLFQKSVS